MEHLISVITINYNDIVGLKKTMNSVFEQSIDNLEYLVIDGGSTDGSKSYIEDKSSTINYWVSEPDNGIYHAMNKGIAKASGKYLLFLNSGDVLLDNKVLEKVSGKLNDNLDIYYGNLKFSYPKKTYERIYPDKLSFSYFYNKTLPHPASFIKRDLFDRVFYYNEELKIVSDWEFFVCAICKHNASYKHMCITVSNFDCKGISSASENKQAMFEERKKCLENHFPLFVDDCVELHEKRNIMKSARFELLSAIESSKIGRGLNTVFLKKLLKVLKSKKTSKGLN